MRRAAVLLLGLTVLAVRADEKGAEINLDGLRSKTPGDWKEETPSNRLRWMQFRVPKAKDDEANGELYLTKGISGSKEDNLKRWKGQFLPPSGKKIDDVTKVENIKVAGCEVMYVDIQGTYLEGPPMAPPAAKKRKPNYRMLAVQFEGPQDVYHIKFTGPAKTIAEHKKGFDEWLKGFKK